MSRSARVPALQDKQPKKRRRFPWKPLVGVLVSVMLVGMLLGRVDLEALRATFSRMKIGWFLAAVALFGAGVLATATRWYLALGRGDTAASFPATVRANYTGQFFNNILFGVSGGDVVKATLYARWNGLDGARVLASCIVDRVLGACGSAVFFLFALIVVLTSGASSMLQGMDMEASGFGPIAIGAATVVIVMIGVFYHFRENAFLIKTLGSLKQNFVRFRDAPRLMAAAIGITVAWQTILCAILALCLRAVVDEPLPWFTIAWVFPAISLITAIPVTFAGAGVRETAALVFLGAYGVSEPEALAAGMLASFIYIIWATVGGIIALMEESISSRSRSTTTG